MCCTCTDRSNDVQAQTPKGTPCQTPQHTPRGGTPRAVAPRSIGVDGTSPRLDRGTDAGCTVDGTVDGTAGDTPDVTCGARRKEGPPDVPLKSWAAAKTYVKNTFVELRLTPREGSGSPDQSRPRTMSEFSGLRQLEEEDRQPSDDVWCPLPAQVTQSRVASRAKVPLDSERAVAEEIPTFQAVYDESGNVYYVPCWMSAPDEPKDVAEDEEAACAPPPPAPGAYTPQWEYGPCWPFNWAPTTLALFALPAELAQTDLVEVLDKFGFSGFYDFVFMPSDSRGINEGRAFVNLTRHEYGLSLAARLHGFKSWGVGSDRVPCEVRWSLPLQGLAEHVEHARDHPANRADAQDARRPLLFGKGWQVPFPSPGCPRSW